MKYFYFRLILVLLTGSLFAPPAVSQPGSNDDTFNSSDTGVGNGANGLIFTTAIQPDGKIIIGGTYMEGIAGIARLNANGTLDGTFNTGDLNAGFDNGFNQEPGRIRTIALQTDGKIIIGGYFLFGFQTYRRMARLNADGSRDQTFNLGGADALIFTTAIQSDGKIIIGGSFTSYNGTVINRIVRLNADGTLDETFKPGTGANGTIFTTTVQSDGNIIIGGSFTGYNGTARNRIARLNADGTLDETFNPGTGANGTIYTTPIQSEGKIIIGGSFTTYNGSRRKRIARLNADGTQDRTFFNPEVGANRRLFTTTIQSDGKIIIGGQFTKFNGKGIDRIARLNTDGSLDATFNPGTGADIVAVFTTAIQSDGKIIVAGEFIDFNGSGRRNIVRLNTNGSLDAAFNSGEVASIYTTVIQSDSKIIIGGKFTTYNGSRRNGIARLNADGTLDGTFNSGSERNATIWTTALQSDGKIIIGGEFTSFHGTGINRIARLNTDGSLDATFNPGTGANRQIQTSAIQSDGKIIIGGFFTDYNGTAKTYIARLNNDGTLDETFNTGTGPNGSIQTIAIQSDGKIIIGGEFHAYNGIARNNIARLNTDGSLDAGFNPGTGADNVIRTIAIQSDGKIIIGGDFFGYNGTWRNRIARVIGDAAESSLPVNFVNVKAYKKTLDIQLEWTTLTEINTDRFVVERSTNGQIFTSIGTVAAKGNSSNPVNYQFLDGAAMTGSYFYRIKSVDKDGTGQYSNVVRVNNKAAGAITVHPNPLTGNTINLQFTNFGKGTYTAIVSNNVGQRLYTSVINHPGGSSTQSIKLNSLPKGTYQLQVMGAEVKTVQQLIIR